MSEKFSSAIPVLLSPKEAAEKCRCSQSFLAKKRMTGDGPPFIKRGRSVCDLVGPRIQEDAILQ